MSASELLALFLHFLSLSVFATGGAIALASDMHRYVVDRHGYITHGQFVDSIALGQAAPGPNILFVTVMGWQIGQLPGAIATTLGLALPALVFPVVISRLSRLKQFERLLQSLKRGLGPVALGLMASTVYLLVRELSVAWQSVVIAAGTLLLLTWTRIPPVVPILVAGALGAILRW